MVMQVLQEGGASIDTAAYHAYHLLTCEGLFEDSPRLKCVHCIPTESADKEGSQAGEVLAGGSEHHPGTPSWKVLQEDLPAGSAWGCSNEGGNMVPHEGATTETTGAERLAGWKHQEWPKSVWLREQAALRLRGLPLDVKGEDGARRLADSLAECMSSSTNFADADLPDLGFSPLGSTKEAFLQRGPFIDPTAEAAIPDYGTQSQTLIIRSVSTSCVYYFYRETQGKAAHEARHLPWTVHYVGAP